MAGRASIVGAAETSVGKVRDHNEDAHFIDPDLGIFLVCDGMGGHAAGEVASQLAVSVIRHRWSGPAIQDTASRWLAQGTLETRKELLAAIRDGVIQAHNAILAEADRDKTKGGMGTTLVGAIVVGADIMFAHAGDSRAYLVRDGIAMQLTEDHTLLARLLAAGVDVDTQGEGARFKSMLTNALGIGQECKVSTFVVPVADGDRFLLCSDGITEYLSEAEIGEVLTTMPSPARSAQRLVELALQRGGGDNATALVVRVIEAGETARSGELLKREQASIKKCPLWSKTNPQQRLRALRIALPRDHADEEKLPALTLGDRVAWVIVDGIVEENGQDRGPGSLLYPEALLADRPLPDKDGLAIAQGEVRALALRSDDFRELCEDDPELAEILLESLAVEISLRRPQRRTGKIQVQSEVDPRGSTRPMMPVRNASEPNDPARAATEPARAGTPAPVELPTEPSKPNLATITIPVNVSSDDPQVPKRTTTQIMRPAPPPGGAPGATLPNVAPGPHPKVPTPLRTPTPAGGVLKTLSPPFGVKRTVTPLKGVPIAPKPHETVPLLTKSLPDSPRMLRASTPSGGLIVPQADRAAANEAVDTVFKNLTVDDEWGDSGPNKQPAIPPALPPPEPEHEPGSLSEITMEADELAEITMEADEPDEPPTEITMEADEPAERPMAVAPALATARPRVIDESEPEISIERLEMEADEPSDDEERSEDPTRPEVVAAAARSSRQITVQPGPLEDPEPPNPRAKRQTDAPD